MQASKVVYSQSTMRPKSFFITPAEYSDNTSHQSTIKKRSVHRYTKSNCLENNSFDLVNQFRVPTHVRMVVSSLFKKPSPVDKQKISERIEKNKDLAVMSKNTKAELAKLKALQSNVRANITKIAKKTIYEQKKIRRQSMLKDKFQKLQYRLNIEDVKVVVKTWLFLGTLVGVGTVSRHLVANRKRLRARSLKLLFWLKGVCKAAGKFIILRRKIKKRYAMRKIRIFCLPLLRNWLRRKERVNRNVLVVVLEQQVSKAMLMKLIKLWEMKMSFLKRQLKNFMEVQRELYEGFLAKWNSTEHLIFEPINDPKKRRRNTMAFKSTKNINTGCTSIPDDIKLYYIRCTIKEIQNNYLELYRSYKFRYNYVHHRNLKNKWSGYPESLLEYPIRPEAPKIQDFFTTEKLTDLINTALKDRALWNKHLESHNRVNLNYFKRHNTQLN